MRARLLDWGRQLTALVSASVLKIIAIGAAAVTSALDARKTSYKLRYWRVGTEPKGFQPLLRNGGAMAATQALNSDTLHTPYLGIEAARDNRPGPR